MKKEYVAEILILLFLLLCAALISFWAFKIFFADKNTQVLYFKDVDGIVVGSPVRFMGVVVGHVNNLKYQGDIISVKILITKKGIRFPKGSKATVEFTGLAGSKSIEIIPPETEEAQYNFIVTESPVRIKEILEYGKSYTNVLLTIENQVNLISSRALYDFIGKISTPYDWSSIDNMLDSGTNNVRGTYGKMNEAIRKEKEFTKRVNDFNQLIENR